MGNDGIFDGSSFLDDPLTENVDETQTLGVEYLTLTIRNKIILYAKYNNKAYKIILDTATYKSEDIKLVYEPNGKEGTKTSEGWTIIYDNGATAEAVSPEAMGNGLRLGDTQIANAVESYNNAITIINDYCKSLEGLPNNIGVRSAGAGTEKTESNYSSNKLSDWNSKYDGEGLDEDMNFEQDLVRMAFWGVHKVGEKYWIASRCVHDYSDTVAFSVCFVHNGDGGLSDLSLWNVKSSGQAEGFDRSCYVRPIITINK